ncbi:hypothetical protein D922_03516 [Enterococcus faecalis 06-MB-DW-09]|nr:hypothetical protein D931_03667 [Enterococcus faecium 13.SD.W.09]EPH89593.1 hypothetical protein D922_03516 [Enterococcus faecalis 06-MB-DW-09]
MICLETAAATWPFLLLSLERNGFIFSSFFYCLFFKNQLRYSRNTKL